MDLYPTLSELAGLETPDHVQGVSLLPLLKDPSATVKEGALSFAKGHSWRTNNWAYMRYTDGTEELYDMRKDPDQFTNLAKNSQHAGRVRSMEVSLDGALKRAGISIH